MAYIIKSKNLNKLIKKGFLDEDLRELDNLIKIEFESERSLKEALRDVLPTGDDREEKILEVVKIAKGWALQGVAFAWLGFAVLVFLAYGGMVYFESLPVSSYSMEKAGQFGDSFGLMTSLFTVFTLGGTIYAILLQRQELRLQRLELKQTRKEFKAQTEALEMQVKLGKQQLEFESEKLSTQKKETHVTALRNVKAEFFRNISMQFPNIEARKINDKKYVSFAEFFKGDKVDINQLQIHSVKQKYYKTTKDKIGNLFQTSFYLIDQEINAWEWDEAELNNFLLEVFNNLNENYFPYLVMHFSEQNQEQLEKNLSLLECLSKFGLVKYRQYFQDVIQKI